MEDPIMPRPAALPRARVGYVGREDARERVPSSESMPPPPAPFGPALPADDASDQIETRPSRSASNSSRSTNRLSLTLPIALPTSFPSRPTPTSSTVGSCPPTPVDTPVLASPSSPGDFITAIAAQERRVLELREELSQAEHALKKLKKEWTHQEAAKKKDEIRRTVPLRPVLPQTDTLANQDLDNATTRRSIELDRRKAILLGQQSGQSTPTQSRRRVFQGGHTRTLSLLSPAKATHDFTVHEDEAQEPLSPSKELDMQFHHLFGHQTPMTPGPLSKRASWAPRSVHQVSGLKQVKQVADEIKVGLWTFVEDLRQATVGEEPITGSGMPLRTVDGGARANYGQVGEDQETIRASGQPARTHVARAFEDSPTPASRFGDALGLGLSSVLNGNGRRASKVDKSIKPFSWTPLANDSFDDQDWSNWDSPTVKSPRWSGSTVNGEAVPPIQEKGDENGTPLKNEVSLDDSSAPSSPTKLNELTWPTALNRLTPGNIKRTASDFMKDWERSLSPPPTDTTVGVLEFDKEKRV